MKQLLSVILVSVALLRAEDPPKPVLKAAPGDVVKVLKPSTPSEGNGYSPMMSVLLGIYPAGSGVSMVWDNQRNAVVVRGPAAAVKQVEDAFNQLDASTKIATPSNPNVEMVVQLVYASAKEDAKGNLPADLQATVQQLRTLFPYAGYRVMDTLLQHGRDGSQVQDDGTVAGTGTPTTPTLFYNFSYIPIVAQGTGTRSVRLRNLKMSVRQNNPTGTSISINTDIDAREGQKTVVGKANVGGTEDAIFLVVTPKLIP